MNLKFMPLNTRSIESGVSSNFGKINMPTNLDSSEADGAMRVRHRSISAERSRSELFTLVDIIFKKKEREKKQDCVAY
jgi:hypothetical protein